MRTSPTRDGAQASRAAAPVPPVEMPPLLTRLRRDALRAFAAGPFYRHTLMGDLFFTGVFAGIMAWRMKASPAAEPGIAREFAR